MIKLHLKSAVAILIILFIILIPGISLSQKKDQSPQKDQVSAKQLDSKNVADEPGSLNLDDLKKIRTIVENAGDLSENELIVPNKEFITGRLVNWSLSDNIIRIRIPIGIAYGSDTDLAEKLMLNTAKANPLVVDHPEPQAVFFGFGDNSLNFELRVFIRSIDDWIPMLHELNRTINHEFRKADVTISFPQRDVHLDQIRPLEVRVIADSNIHPQMNAYINPSDKSRV
jgi:hypothetical protein